ncbi:MAG: ATP-dependent helicase [Devosia nanyangense]|uniref:DNA 3'-5' helicase n=1 Tax=Devosia nanyangense TaxID=1228055 RepID=A0A933L1L0_9HYPH|nr:ATP-dependent helicase [Devosia nanyangense]
MLAEIDYLHRLNPEQRRAVEHGVGDAGGGPLLVIAGAGSGKTNTLAHRVAHLIVNGADPRRILLMTFSRRAAGEMSRRVERIAGQVMGTSSGAVADALAWAGTFHGIGARLLREYAQGLGLDPQFTIHDREDSADLINIVRHDLGLHEQTSRFPAKGTCLAIYSRTVNAQDELAETLKTAFPWAAMWEAQLRELFSRYVRAKQDQNVLDYDDLLLYWAVMMKEPAIAADLGARFDHVLVDEYQDTNRLQSAILLALKPDGAGLTVVGDDAQSIYSFRAATVRNILEFPSSFAPPARIITLDRNYRSTAPILDAANAVIAEAEERFTKNLWTDRKSEMKPQLVTVRDEADQARYVVERVLEAREGGARLKDQAVLFRTSSHSGPLEIELTRRNIPFVKFGGLKFLDAAHVKDMLALLRWAENPRDRVAGFRVLQLLPGIGPTIAGRVLDAMDEAPRPFAALAELPAPSRGEGWPGFVEVVADLAATPVWPATFARARLWYEPILAEAHDDAAIRLLDLLQLEQIASGYPSRERFLTELTLDPPDATSDQSGVPHRDEDYLILSTIHSAKGQEWRSVHVLNVVDGCIPSDLGTGSTHELEEERRLLYVAMTRARDELHLLVPQRFFVTQQQKHGDRHLYAQRSRFVTRAMLPLYDDILWPALKPLATEMAPKGPAIDLRAQMRDMWAK